MAISNWTTPGMMSSSPPLSLRRGQACLTCRRRKTKCDAARPACKSCIREGLQATCQYQPPSNETLELGRRVRELRSRLRELERSRVASEGIQSPSTSQSASTRNASGDRFPTKHDTERLVSVFFSDEQPLWFLHRERFCATVASSTRIPEQAHPALLASVCALGARNNTAGDLTALAPVLLNIALSSINQRLDSDELHYAHSALQLIQARVLLGGLLMSSGQALQGATLLSGACSLTLTLGLHNPYATVGGIAVVPVPMGRPLPPMNGVEAAEGAGAFWVTATLDRLWALALGKRPRVNLDALEVHTAWFKRPEFYGQPGHDSESLITAIHSMRELSGDSTSAWRMDISNSIGVLVTAADLYEQSASFSRGLAIDVFKTSVQSDALASRADWLTAELEHVLGADTLVLAAYILACGVSIQLHSRSGGIRAVNASRALASAASTFRLDPSGPGWLEVVIGRVIPAACLVMMTTGGIVSYTQTGSTEQAPECEWQSLRGVLEHWATRSVYVRSSVERMQQDMTVLGL